MMINKKVVIFDFDGTIADTFEIVLNLMLKHAKFLGIKNVDDETIKKLRNFPLIELIEELDISKIKIPFVAWLVKRQLGEEIHNIKPFKGMVALIESLKKQGFVVGIVSSNSRRNIHEFIESNKMDIFDFFHTERNLFGKGVVLERLIKKEHFDKSNVVYVGDEVRDIMACRKTGIKVISVSWGYNTKEILEKHNKEFVVDTPHELELKLSKIF